MANVDINGTIVEFPDNLSADQLNSAVAKAAQQMNGAVRPGLVKRAFETAKIPGQTVEHGYKLMADLVPTPTPRGNLTGDVLRGTPSILAQTAIQGVGKGMNEMVLHPANAVGLGLAKPALVIGKGATAVARGLGKLVSRTSGINPESLAAAALDATTVFKPGIQKANQLFGLAKDAVPLRLTELPSGKMKRAALKSLMQTTQGTGTVANAQNKKVIDKAMLLAKSGQLSPRLALLARQAVDDLYSSKSVSGDFVGNARKIFDAIVKESPHLARASNIRRTAEYSDQLRELFPLTKSGGTGQFRTMVGLGVTAANPILGLGLSPLFSPMVQGGMAATGGMIGRRALMPLLRRAYPLSAVGNVLKNRLSKREDNDGR
jgi:hypothetical protein